MAAQVPPVGTAGQGEESSQVQQMFSERLNAQREATATMSQQLQRLAAENLQESRSPQQQRPQATKQGDISTGEVEKRLKEFSQRFNQIVEQNPAFNIRIGIGRTPNGDPLMLIIDKNNQEVTAEIPSSQSRKIAANMELFTNYFVERFSQPGPIEPGSFIDKKST